MNIQKLRDMNLGAVADELEQLRKFKEEQLKEVETMEVKELRDRIQEIHNSGDCGYMLSDVLEMANELCSKAYQLNLAELGDEQLASAGLMRKCVTDEMISRAMSVVIGSSGDYGTYNEHLSKDSAREVLEAALSVDEIRKRDRAKLRTKYLELVEKYEKLAEKYDKLSKKVSADKPARITEQDAREIAESCLAYWLYKHPMEFHVGDWLVTKGRELLNKLNADREQVSDDAPAQKLWDYYQTLLRHYGFEGITDLLSKYRKLVEQVPVVTMPDVATPEMEAAAEKYWNERRLKGLSDDPRTWAGVYAAMRAAAPSNSQQSEEAGVSALVEALEEARLTLQVLQGKGSSAELTLAIIDRALAAYRKGE